MLYNDDPRVSREPGPHWQLVFAVELGVSLEGRGIPHHRAASMAVFLVWDLGWCEADDEFLDALAALFRDRLAESGDPRFSYRSLVETAVALCR